MTIENILFEISDALRYPVLIGSVLALIVAIAEVGSLLAEQRRRRVRSVARTEHAVDLAREALAAGDRATALRAVRSVGYNDAMNEALEAIVEQRDHPDAANRIAKRLAEYDYRSVKRLERTRILVRMGPALGLMGTLIPLSPALAALGDGDVERLTDDLRVAFSVTVAGLLIGAIAFAVSLVRDRMYDQDYSDIEYVNAQLATFPAAAPPLHTHPRQSVGMESAAEKLSAESSA
ncbi:MotA/TolQ/ExbB proton channel family protein [Conexibacter stalactiti]|uniref:MotA/TolQ/ExbB proton channel family protein n=1 Tax=Conexibacter stalactiti TaxID=1940611 RepID=A0ABU4HIS7_9ACTN|nr:MotA/TolQ/ExbB proton channel family protein [Conexibacter stalactiti]MDW5593201.1 MotA/TolQ/ExbB proton channel family protein [Conexibacter stalactiti]MEC5033842.1 MotA/TolQ/ExbB proton channel family protein [Conexibacter stalactiti]